MTPAQVFSCEFCEIFKNILLTEHLQATASEWVFVFPGPRLFAWRPTLALAPNLYLPALVPYLYLPALGLTLCLPTLTPNLYLPALTPTLCLPQICIYWLSPGLEFAYTDLVSPICIYWPWPTICTHTGC